MCRRDRCSAVKYDKEGDEHYDLLSAFQKSMRGSDPDAATYYWARLLSAGDLPSVCRRLMVCACEDVGLAWPQIIPIVKASVDAALQVGLPEAQLPLADAVILVCCAPKSNSAHNAIISAMEDLFLIHILCSSLLTKVFHAAKITFWGTSHTNSTSMQYQAMAKIV